LPGLELAGIMGYEGHLLLLENGPEKDRQIREALDLVGDTKRLLEASGIPCGIVSCGGTGSYLYTVKHPDVTELQAGGAMFMDAFYRHMCHVPDLQYAMTVIATVVSRPTPERAIMDAGRKTLNIEQTKPLVINREGIEVERLSAEHGQLKLAPEAQDLRIGDRLTIIPGYSDLTAVLHNDFYCLRGGRLEAIWPLVGRGRLQ
jgi:D-serine deaminase-like pyridoxal phosphate-dependent protein